MKKKLKSLDELEKIRYGNYSFPRIDIYRQAEITRQLTEELIRYSIKQTFDAFDNLSERAFASQKSDVKEKYNLQENEIESLNDGFIQKYFKEKLQKEIEKITENQTKGWGDDYYEEKAKAEMSDNEQIAKAVAVLKEAFAASLNYPYGGHAKEEEQKANEIQAAVNELPPNIKSQVEDLLSRGYGSINSQYQKMVDFTQNLKANKNQIILEAAYKDLIEKLETVLAEMPDYYFTSEVRLLHDKKQEIARAQVRQMLSESYPGEESEERNCIKFDVRRWVIFRDDEKMKTILGNEQLRDADKFYADTVGDNLLKEQPGTDTAVSRGDKLLNFHYPEHIPLCLMSAWRDPWYNLEYQRKKNLAGYLASFTDKELEELAEKNIPGLMEAITIIKANPDTFYESEFRDEKGQRQKNPTYKSLQQCLINFGSYELAIGDEKIQDFSLDFLKRMFHYIESDWSAFNKVAGDILAIPRMDRYSKSERQPEIEKKIIAILLDGAKHKDEQAIDVLLANPNNVPAEFYVPQLTGALAKIANPPERQINALAKILNITSEELKSALNFIGYTGDIYEQGYGGSYQSDKLKDYIELAKNLEILPFIKELVPFGYNFNINHAQILPEMLKNRIAILQGIAEIQKISLDYNYPDYAYDHFPTEFKVFANKTETVLIYNPYEIFIQNFYSRNNTFLDVCDLLYKMQKEKGAFNQEFSDALLRTLRWKDIFLKGEEKEQIDESVYQDFNKALQKFLPDVIGEDDSLKDHQNFYLSRDGLQFLARRPEKAELFFKFAENGGELLKKERSQALTLIFNNEFELLQDITDLQFLNHLTELFGADTDYFIGQYLQRIQSGAISKENRDEYLQNLKNSILPTLKKLREYNLDFNLKNDRHCVIEVAANDLLDLFEQFKDNKNSQKFIFYNALKLGAIPKEKRKDYLDIFLKIDESPSQEIQRLKEQLLEGLLETNNPSGSYEKINDIFIKNNLPTVGKVFKVFAVLHKPEEIKKKLSHGSPVLTQTKSSRRLYDIFYRDLLKIHIASGNRSLRQYCEILKEGEKILGVVDEKGTDNLTYAERKKLEYFFDKISTLFVNSALGRNFEAGELSDKKALNEQYQNLRRSLGCKPGQKITERISQMFLKPVGLDNLDDVLSKMHEAKKTANARGIKYAGEAGEDALEIQAGDLLKVVDANYIENILQNGSVAKEFLGPAASSDYTPFDTDVTRLQKEVAEQGFSAAVSQSKAIQGELLFCLKDRGQFDLTEREKLAKYNFQKLELFVTDDDGGNHYGIRTGFPTTEIDFMIAEDSLLQNKRNFNKICYEIAQNGWYIPIADTNGKIVFTPEIYDEYRKIFNGLERFDGNKFEFIPADEREPYYQQIEEIIKDKRKDEKNISYLSETIKETLREVFENLNMTFKDEFSASIIGAELLNIGSTGRDTNLPGDYDFDFTLKLDAHDFNKAAEIAGKLRDKFALDNELGRDESHAEAGGYYQLKVSGIARINGKEFTRPLNIDIGFAKKSDLMVFGSHDSILEKLNSLEKFSGENAREQVIANIILCKKILSQGGAYKKTDGGFGGVGVENWILANNGDIKKTFVNFREAAHESGEPLLLDKFKEKYKLLDAGINIKKLFHDNYVENLTKDGYEKMLRVIDEFLAENS